MDINKENLLKVIDHLIESAERIASEAESDPLMRSAAEAGAYKGALGIIRQYTKCDMIDDVADTL